MTIQSYVLGIAAAAATLVIVIELLRRRHLRERHAIWWLTAGVLALVAGVFPATLVWAADVVGIEVPINLVFFVSIAVLFLVCLQHSAELTKLESKTQALAERIALLELEIASAQRPSDSQSRD
ncbi:DUF2304 domain-containing protein [Homoserinimonas hongtaonis]|uniref:DUF2304 domain-containing protein n=1 Tax=Homoserinimonas hongtaonis TaxID=2079791 RepID=A0A2U1SWP3_9MICO|nr:DUF2304 domain-containing protein [Salinibacterium hongtaonis]PWB96055.1 DUF2304 domain-containing protein [Salinibacterium hongtaonis]